jgi:hypothetical protein
VADAPNGASRAKALPRLVAQVDVSFSNSVIEVVNKILKNRGSFKTRLVLKDLLQFLCQGNVRKFEVAFKTNLVLKMVLVRMNS